MEAEGVVGRLLGLLLGLLIPLVPPSLLVLSSFQLPGLRSLGSSLMMMPGLGEGVRPGDEPGMRLSSSFMSGLSGGVGRGSSSASSGSCMTVSVFSLPSTTSCSNFFFRYSGPVQEEFNHYITTIFFMTSNPMKKTMLTMLYIHLLHNYCYFYSTK